MYIILITGHICALPYCIWVAVSHFQLCHAVCVRVWFSCYSYWAIPLTKWSCMHTALWHPMSIPLYWVTIYVAMISYLSSHATKTVTKAGCFDMEGLPQLQPTWWGHIGNKHCAANDVVDGNRWRYNIAGKEEIEGMGRWNPSSLLDTMPSNENGFCSSLHSFVGNTSLGHSEPIRHVGNTIHILYVWLHWSSCRVAERLGFDWPR